MVTFSLLIFLTYNDLETHDFTDLKKAERVSITKKGLPFC